MEVKFVKVIKKNLDNFCITSCKVLNMDYLKCLDYLKGVKFDLIFLQMIGETL